MTGLAPENAPYVVVSASANLSNESVLTAGSGITLTPGAGTLTVATTAAIESIGFSAIKSGDLSIPNATYEPVDGAASWTLDYNDGTPDFDITTGTWTASVAGHYQVNAQIAFASSNVGGRRLAVVVTGLNARTYVIQKAAEPNALTLSFSHILEIAIGDTVLIQAYQDTGGALNLLAQVDTKAATLFSINRL